jgi:hypothetical protein
MLGQYLDAQRRARQASRRLHAGHADCRGVGAEPTSCAGRRSTRHGRPVLSQVAKRAAQSTVTSSCSRPSWWAILGR